MSDLLQETLKIFSRRVEEEISLNLKKVKSQLSREYFRNRSYFRLIKFGEEKKNSLLIVLPKYYERLLVNESNYIKKLSTLARECYRVPVHSIGRFDNYKKVGQILQGAAGLTSGNYENSVVYIITFKETNCSFIDAVIMGRDKDLFQ